MIVVTGASGQLGSEFVRRLGAEAVPLTRAKLDLSDPSRIDEVIRSIAPSAVINCAAYTAVDRAEEEPDLAQVVNCEAVERLAATCRRIDARFVSFSTDYVFDGTSEHPYVESDPTAPINTYGRTKRDGEIAAMEADPTTLIVRTSWVLSGTHPNFAATMLRLAAEGAAPSVVDDQRGRPTLVADLVPASLEALAAGTTGLLHLADDGATTWYGLAKEVFEIAGHDPDRVTPCSTAEFPRPARRPANSVLDSERLAGLGLSPMPHYRRQLERAVISLQGGRA